MLDRGDMVLVRMYKLAHAILFSKVLKGDPSLLSSKYKKLQHRTLFLCYPDEGCAMAGSCLENIDMALASRNPARDPTSRLLGDFIIHVGELIHTGCASGAPQAPWGRSSAPDFQVGVGCTQLHYGVLMQHR
jgi:hypothetical protein